MDSIVAGNTASNGSGIFCIDATVSTITNATIYVNTATTGDGGAIRNANGLLEQFKSTVSGNTAILSGGVATFGHTQTRTDVSSSIIASNKATTAGYGNDVGSHFAALPTTPSAHLVIT